MLTFRFTGAAGEMIEEEILTAGMTGKQVRFEFSSDWDGLRKAVIYRSGPISCTDMDVQETDTIPAAVLAVSLHRLYVGVYGMSEDGSTVTPTVYARGPLIRIGAVPGEDQEYDPEDPFWQEMEDAIGDLGQLITFEKANLVEAINENRTLINAIPRQESQVWDENTRNLLLSILEKGTYSEDQSANLAGLAMAMDPGKQVFWVALKPAEAIAMDASPVAEAGKPWQAQIRALYGKIEALQVLMGGKDITADVYADGTVSIGAVTGDIVIRAEVADGYVDAVFVVGTVMGGRLEDWNDYQKTRMSAVLTEGTVPFPTSFTTPYYLIPVPPEATALTVECPDLHAGPQFFTLEGEAFTQALDCGWQALGGFTYAIEAGAYDYVGINFKNATNTDFTDTYDTAQISICFQ